MHFAIKEVTIDINIIVCSFISGRLFHHPHHPRTGFLICELWDQCPGGKYQILLYLFSV